MRHLRQLGTEINKAVRSVNLQFCSFVAANLLSCAADVYFGFFVDNSTTRSSPLSTIMHFIENVAVLAPLNYVLIVHRKALSKERIGLLEEYE